MSFGRYLSPRDIVVQVGDVDYTIPGVTADKWLEALTIPAQDIATAVLPGMLGAADQGVLMQALISGDVSPQDIQAAALDAIREASCVDWWEAIRLVGSVDQPRGELYGSLLLAGVDPARVTFAAWCAALLAHLMAGRDEKERSKLLQSLIMPPVGMDIEDVEGWDTPAPW